VAASLVARLHNEHEKKANAAKAAYDYQLNGIIEMAFDDKYIDAINKNGFLNQHQVANSNGGHNPQLRANAEDKMLRVLLEPTYVDGGDNIVNTIRPKYSYLGFKIKTYSNQTLYFTPSYGNVVAVLNDEVKDRSTFTPDDSLGFGHNGEKNYTFEYRSRHPIDDPPGAYWETQTWGTITTSDVQYFLIGCPGARRLNDSSVEKLKAIGLPIYQCQYSDEKISLDKGPLIYPGDPEHGPKPHGEPGTEMDRVRAQ
jgi:hypothetical protein